MPCPERPAALLVRLCLRKTGPPGDVVSGGRRRPRRRAVAIRQIPQDSINLVGQLDIFDI